MPKRRAWLLRIKNELGGWSGLLERRAMGAKWGELATDVGCSRSFLRYLIVNGSDKLRAAVDLANKEYAEHIVEESLTIVDGEMLTRDDIERAKMRSAHRRWLASVYDREKFGEPKDKNTAPPISIGELHIQALIHAPQPARQLSSGPSAPVASEQPAAPVSES
jgi:hypothetical protein